MAKESDLDLSSRTHRGGALWKGYEAVRVAQVSGELPDPMRKLCLAFDRSCSVQAAMLVRSRKLGRTLNAVLIGAFVKSK